MLNDPPHNKPSPILETIGWILLSAYVMVLPIGHTVALRNLLFFSLTAISIWLALRSRIQISVPIFKPWLLYVAIAFISLTYAIDPWYSLGEIKTEIGFGFLAMILGATWIRAPEQFSRLMWAIIACNVFLVAGSIYFALKAHIQGNPLILISSFNVGIGKLSTYIVLMLPLIVAQCWALPDQRRTIRAFLIVLIAANIAALYFTGNRAGLVALLIEAIVFALVLLKYPSTLLQNPKFWLIVVLAILFIGSLEFRQIVNRDAAASTSASVSTDPRWVVWKFAAQNIVDRPFTGGGFGLHAFKLLNPDYSKNNPANNSALWHAHNTLLNVGIQTGLPGIATFIILMLAALRKVSAPLREMSEWNTTRIYSLAAVVMFAGLVVKLQTDDFFSRDIALFFWLIVGALSATQRTFATK